MTSHEVKNYENSFSHSAHSARDYLSFIPNYLGAEKKGGEKNGMVDNFTIISSHEMIKTTKQLLGSTFSLGCAKTAL